jgi:hypothetical protein
MITTLWSSHSLGRIQHPMIAAGLNPHMGQRRMELPIQISCRAYALSYQHAMDAAVADSLDSDQVQLEEHIWAEIFGTWSF